MSRPVLHILIVSPNGSFCPLIVCHSVRIWLTCSLACADAGIFARRIQARLPENSSDNVCFRHQLILPFYRGCSMVISKTTIIIQGFREVPKFTRWGGGGGGGGSNFSRGIKMLISIETDITCDISRESRLPIPTSGSVHDWIRIG